MEVVDYAARANLRRLLAAHPQWTQQQYAQAVGMSVGWVKKWKPRLLQAGPSDEQVLHSRSRARRQPPERLSQTVVDRLVQLRDEPPEGLQRPPGPKALLYYLPRDPSLQGERLPRCSRTIYRLLKQAGRIASRQPAPHEPLERPALLSHWQLDFKDVTTVPPEEGGKRQHALEALHVIDEGTSVVLAAQLDAHFHAETTLEALAQVFRQQGLPERIQVDRDVRFVSSPQGSDFPSALLHFCQCLGVAVRICDPHHPQQNGFVERYHRTYEEECLRVERPRTVEAAREVTAAFVQHYNWQRPHQGLSCGNVPPRVAFASLPSLPAVPDLVDPERWLRVNDGLALTRQVRHDGTVRVDLTSYYLGVALRGQRVALHLSAPSRSWLVVQHSRVLKSLPLKGLLGQAMRFEAFVQHMTTQARAERRLRTAQERRVRLRGTEPP